MISLALTLIQAQAAPARDFAPIEVFSADKACVARIHRAAGQERVAANMARFTLTVLPFDEVENHRELWSTAYSYDSSQARYVLANFGRAFVELEEHFSESHTVLMIHAPGREAVKWSGAELSIPRKNLGGTNQNRSWLDDKLQPSIAWTDGAFGPCLELDIPCRDGFVRKLDLERLRLIDSSDESNMPRVLPAIQGTLPERSALPYVVSVQYPRVARAGREIEIRILGNHATPGWTFLGFELEQGEGKLILTPHSQAPDGIQAQVLTVFRTSARLSDLPIGRYTLEISGWSPGGPPATLDVLPGSILASLRTRGGFAGIDQSLEVHEQGLLRAVMARDQPAGFMDVDAGRMTHMRELIAALPAKDRRATTANAADLFKHTLGFWSGDNWITLEVDDLAATETERELIKLIRAH